MFTGKPSGLNFEKLFSEGTISTDCDNNPENSDKEPLSQEEERQLKYSYLVAQSNIESTYWILPALFAFDTIGFMVYWRLSLILELIEKGVESMPYARNIVQIDDKDAEEE